MAKRTAATLGETTLDSSGRSANNHAAPTKQEMIDFQLSLRRQGQSYEQIQEQTYFFLIERTGLEAKEFDPIDHNALFKQNYRILPIHFYTNEVDARILTEKPEKLKPSARAKPRGAPKPLPQGRRRLGILADLDYSTGDNRKPLVIGHGRVL